MKLNKVYEVDVHELCEELGIEPWDFPFHKEDDEYLNFLAKDYNIEWNEEKIYFPFEQGDQSIIIENQRAAKINFKNLSSEYKDGLIELANRIVPEIRNGEIKRVIKNI